MLLWRPTEAFPCKRNMKRNNEKEDNTFLIRNNLIEGVGGVTVACFRCFETMKDYLEKLKIPCNVRILLH